MQDIINEIFFNLVETKYKNVKVNFKTVFEQMLLLCRSIPDFDKVKFVSKDPNYGDEQYKAVYFFTHEDYIKPKMPDNVIKKKKNTKLTYDPEVLEKFPVSTTASPSTKIIAFNPAFERVFRHNIFECINKQFKLEEVDKDVMKSDLEEFYSNIQSELFNKTAEAYQKDLFEYKVDGQDPNLNISGNMDMNMN